jgi:hypothetical protein
MAAIRQPLTFLGSFVCLDSRIENTMRPSLCVCITNPTPFTISKIFESTKIRRNPREISSSRSGTRAGCQSEADWAYAKRALFRGDDPETIIQRIADYRADDKGDPLYYARHTVQKAQAELPGRSGTGSSAEGEITYAKEIGFHYRDRD